MSSPTATHSKTPGKPHDKTHDKDKHSTGDSVKTTGTHGKTEIHEPKDAHRKSVGNEHMNVRRTSDAEKHAYADAHSKAAHPGIAN